MKEKRKLTRIVPCAFPYILFPTIAYFEIEMHHKIAHWWKIGPVMLCFELSKD